MTTQKTQLGNLDANIRGRYAWLPIAIILVIATGVFTFRLGNEGVWIDELFSIRDASAFDNPLEIYKASRLRPLYYVLLSVWMRFGSSDAWLRLLSVIFAIISVFLIYRLGRRIAGEAEGLIAAALLTTSPLFINHAQEIRMYALSLCMGLAGTLFLADALLTERPRQPSQKTLAGWALFRLLAICTVPLNITLLFPDALLIFLRFRKERAVLLSFGKWVVLLLILWSPAVAPLLKDASPSSAYAAERDDFAAAPGLGNLVYPLKFWMVWPFVVRGSIVAHFFYKSFTLLIAALIGAGLIHKRKSPTLNWSIAWFTIPLVPIIAFSLVSARIWEPRYVLFASPYLFILIAAGFTRLWREWKVAAIVAIAIYSIGMGGALTHYYTVQNRADYKFNIETVEQYEQQGDAMVWSYGWELAVPHYYDGNADVYFQSGRDIETPEAIEQWISEFPAGYDRTWLVVEKLKPIADSFESIVAKTYNIEKTFNYNHGSAVFLLTPLNQASHQTKPISSK